MPTASTSTSFDDREEKTNGFKLMRLIIDLGTEALRNEFKKKHPGNLHTVLCNHKSTLNRLKVRNVITQPQWDKLYPPGTVNPNIKEFDITLLVILLRNICGIRPPSEGWNNMPRSTDSSLEANIVRVKLFRNEFFGHIPKTNVTTKDFETCWKEVSTTLVNLGISQEQIDRLKDRECGEEEVDRVRREWSENETKLAIQLLGIKGTLLDIQSDVKSIKAEQTSSDNINLNKYLASCNFDTNIELINQKWCKGTREWVFDQVSNWFKDTTSDSRAFIITGQAGMGKSVIAAVICKRFAKQLAACHFCQYNDNRYNDPKILLQSLATQLSNVIPLYKKALIKKLSGKEGERLDDMNIQSLFSLLFKEPLTGIQVAGKHLIVIDAVDESEHEGRSDLVYLIANYLCELPSFIRFLITSRPENDIAKKLEKLKPMLLSRNNEQSIQDMQHFFEDKLASPKLAKHIGKLVEKSDGLMLFADCLYQILKDCRGQFDIDLLPTGIEAIYESYFKRLTSELEVLKVTTEVSFSFLSVIAVAKQPLPIALIDRIFSSDDDSPATLNNKISKIKNCLSSLLVIGEDRISLFHKSVKDWLVQPGHNFTVDEKFGHETLSNICAREMDEIKKNGVKPPFCVAAEYALLYGTQHKLAGIQGAPLETFINRYVIDLEIMYACVTVDVYTLFENVTSLKNSTIYKSLPEKTCKTVETLMLLIRKYINSLKDFPQSFLQRVLNWGGDELSLKAASLLKSRYKERVYFEITEKDDFEDSLVGRVHLSKFVVGIDISPSEDHVICLYLNNMIELFTSVDFKSLWTVQHEKPPDVSLWFRPIVFHPLENVILPGMLDPVINLHGEFEPGPLFCKDINPRFDNCCFSNDNRKMATTYKNDLTVWNLVSNEKLESLSSNKPLKSVLFSANGRFLATSDEGKTVVVYDLEKDFIRISKSFDQHITFVSTFEADSWYCYTGRSPFFRDVCTLRSDLFVGMVDSVYLKDRRIIPLNVKAVAEFETAMKNGEKSWLRKFHSIVFFCLDNGITLVLNLLGSTELEFFRISNRQQAQSMTDDPLPCANCIDISVDGKFIYATDGRDSLNTYKIDSNFSILRLPSYPRKHKTPFAAVINGVFFCGKLDDRKKWFGPKPRIPNDIPELWNSDLTKRLNSFPDLSGTIDCLSVSEEIVACIMAGKVCFFDVLERKMISETRVPQNMAVVACSSKYHVLMSDEWARSLSSLWRAGEVVSEWKDIFNKPVTLGGSSFSPSGKTLVLSDKYENHLLIFNVSPAKIRHKIDLGFFSYSKCPFVFLDEDLLLCRAYEKSMHIINVTSGNTLTCIDFIHKPMSWCVSRTPDNCSVILCVNTNKQKTKVIKVWLPRQT